uniref:histidine-tRNA synthetase n=1 Tax=Pseudoerythrocladia kornmannii TaxID=753682 RepID=UPI001FCCFA9A|nr:histidine-tRNA synthetase [Pseudoerythrocladia kornmannii]UNJ16753.1 histidine-tRNA synthetase [Pseudoerythrocladia kornmannii]
MNSLRGTCDILPDEMKYWHFIEKKASCLLANANYTEIRTPIIEQKELFARGVGLETDIVNKEMYSFEDQGKRQITLRPEGTAGITRSFIEHKLYSDKPSYKFWYKGAMFRYERPQSGRQRQFHQLGVECLGIKDARIDAEVISLAYNFLTSIGIKELSLEINTIGSKLDRKKYEAKLVNYLQVYYQELDSDSQKRLNKNPLRILDSKNRNTQKILNKAPLLFDEVNDNSKQHFEILCIYLNALKIPYVINYKLVRGLDYYNDTAFEFKTSLLGGQDTLCGGGRYDNLIEELGGPNTPAIGWAIGIERLLLLLKQKIHINNEQLDVYIVSDNSIRCKVESIIMFNKLRHENIKVDMDQTNSTIRKKIKRAYKLQSRYCLIIGEEEIKKGKITLKNLTTNNDETINAHLEMAINSILT